MNNVQISVKSSLLSVLMLVMAGGVSNVSAQSGAEHLTGDAVRGAKTWANNCSRCHNMRSPSEFRDDEWRLVVTHMRMRAGFTGKQARDTLAFLQASNTPASVVLPSVASAPTVADSSVPVSGPAIYAQTCVACHGANGKGVLPGVPDFTSESGPLSKSNATLVDHVMNGFQSPGSAMAMPAKGGKADLTTAGAEEVVRYLRESFAK